MNNYVTPRTSFRPLAGIMVLIGTTIADTGRNPGSFRPLAGIMVLIVTIEAPNLYRAIVSFRPLAGIMVLISTVHFR